MARKFYQVKVLLSDEQIEQLKQAADEMAEDYPTTAGLNWREVAAIWADVAITDRLEQRRQRQRQTEHARQNAADLLAGAAR